MPEGSHRHDALCSQNVGNSLGSRPCVRQTPLYKRHESGNAMKALLGMPHLSWEPDCKRAEAQKPVGDRRRRLAPRQQEDRWDKITSADAGKLPATKKKEACKASVDESDAAKVPARHLAPHRSAIGVAGRIVTHAPGDKAAACRGGSQAGTSHGSVAECLTMQDLQFP
ncbi:unnamed protein product [Symbiodinium microadriaticum]|nr:unnamed protein product [Symbiodinium sp. KB8]CAE7876237.1 unnamed protein product [Symbiodinium microadriaticum]